MFLEIHHILTRYCINHKSMYMRRSDRLTLQCNSFQHSPRSLRASAWSPNHTLPITERSRTMNRSTGYAEYDTSHFFNLPTYLNTEKGGTKIRRKSDLIMGLNYQRSVGLVGVGFFFRILLPRCEEEFFHVPCVCVWIVSLGYMKSSRARVVEELDVLMWYKQNIKKETIRIVRSLIILCLVKDFMIYTILSFELICMCEDGTLPICQ